MRTVKRLLCLAVLAAFFVALPKGFAEPRDSWSLEARVPASCLGFVSMEDIGGMQAKFEQSAIAGLFREPEMQAFGEPIVKALEALVSDAQAEGGPFGEATPLVMKLFEQLQGLRGQIAVAILDVDMDAGMPQAVASLDFGANVGDFITFLQTMRKEIDPEGNAIAEYEKEGRTWWQVQDGPPITATTVDTAFVLATSPTILEGVVRGGGETSLATHAHFQAVRAKAGGDDLGLFAFANVPAIVDLVGAQMGPDAARIANHLGLDTIKGAAYGMAFAGDGFMDSIIVHAPGADHGIVPLLSMPAYQPRAVPFAPANAFYFEEGAVNYDTLLPRIRTLVQGIDADMAGELDEGIAHVNQMLGVDLEKDVLGGMKGHAAAYASMPDTGGLYPEVALLFQVKDPAAFEATLEQVARGIAGMASEEGDIIASTRTLDYHRSRLHLFEMQKAHGDDVVPFTPTWALLDDWFVITLVPHAMKEIVLRREGTTGGGLASQEDYQSLRRVMPGDAGAMTYIDLQAILNLVYDSAVPLLQTAAKANVLGKQVPFPMDWALLPATRTVRPYFRSMAVFSTWNHDGIKIQMHAPLPLMGVMMTAAAVAVPYFTVMRDSPSRRMRRVEAVPAVPVVPGVPGVRVRPKPGKMGPQDPKQRMAMLQAEQISSYVRVFVLTQKRLPSELSELVSKDVAANVPTDPWGNDYWIEVLDAKERRFRVVSAGADGRKGTADDVAAGK